MKGKCKYCETEFEKNVASHERLCPKNPDRRILKKKILSRSPI
jgi:hypothetical protein